MDPLFRELFDLLLRWAHLIAGIMWIGNSMLFNHTDRNLKPAPDAKEGHLGEIWWLHGGGFYRVEKQTMPKGQLPALYHWFKWQSYTTWVSGFFLLAVVYYLSQGLLVDPAVANIPHGVGVALGLGALFGGFALYDWLWRSPLGKHGALGLGLTLGLLGAIAYGLTLVLSPRAAFLHVGALLGTWMAGNVFMHIIPSQKKMVAQLEAGGEHDLSLGGAAKTRSIHNNYLTFPMLFLMISNHFPSVYGSANAFGILVTLIVGGALVRHLMNIRFTYPHWRPALAATVMVSLSTLTMLLLPPAGATLATAPAPGATPVSFQEARGIITQRCNTCHSASPTDDTFHAPPGGVVFDTPDQIKRQVDRIRARTVDARTMPLANKTAMTDAERAALGRWIKAGAKLE